MKREKRMENEATRYKIGFVKKACSFVDFISLWTGKISAYVVLIMTLLTTYDVFCRYVLNAPNVWAQTIISYGLCVITFLGAGYAVLKDENVRVDILYHKFPLRVRAASELITWILVYSFCIVIIWKGWESAYEALKQGEKSMGIMEFPMFPTLVLVPIGALLILLQSIARNIRNILTLITGQDEVNKALSSILGE